MNRLCEKTDGCYLGRFHFPPCRVREEPTERLIVLKRNVDVHLTHCCQVHGCKYGDDECEVFEYGAEPTYPNNNGCEQCQADAGHAPDPAAMMEATESFDLMLGSTARSIAGMEALWTHSGCPVPWGSTYILAKHRANLPAFDRHDGRSVAFLEGALAMWRAINGD